MAEDTGEDTAERMDMDIRSAAITATGTAATTAAMVIPDRPMSDLTAPSITGPTELESTVPTAMDGEVDENKRDAVAMHLSSFERKLPQGDDLLQRVLSQLKSRLGTSVHDFQLTVCADGLVLRGRVKSYYGKQLAQAVVMEVCGMPVQANDIEVERGLVAWDGLKA